MTDDPGGTPNSKVARVIEKYDLTEWGERLECEWLGETGERTSLRDLASQFNRAVLAAALRRAGEAPIEYDVESTYRILTDDGVPQADTLRKERELERLGIDVADLGTDFVTHQAIHTYLTTYRGAELDDRSPDPEQKVETLERLEGRTAAVAESTLDELVDAGKLTDGDYQLFLDIRTVCEECGADYQLVELVRRGGCHCND